MLRRRMRVLCGYVEHSIVLPLSAASVVICTASNAVLREGRRRARWGIEEEEIVAASSTGRTYEPKSRLHLTVWRRTSPAARGFARKERDRLLVCSTRA